MNLLRKLFHTGVVVTFILSASIVAEADEPVFQVSVDRNRIGQDESVALKFKVVTSGMGGGGEEPEFSAPDFDLVNQYSSIFVESYYENGKFGARNNRQYTKVLRPQRQGNLIISRIRLKFAGKMLEHPPIQVTVVAGGAGAPPPAGYGGAGVGLRGAAKKPREATIPFFVRAEVDHAKVFKGQRVVVSYYLYQRARVHNIQVDKYPVLDGFLREDLELPILGQRLTDRESVVLDGVAYERVLLARYAAYPLKEGRLSIESMAIKGSYMAPPGGLADIQDPMTDLLQNFMQQLQPRTWSHRSDPVIVEVKPLPLEGRPSSFSGGVGDFEITSVVDKPTARVNEPITFMIKVEGSGNIGAISQPSTRWPQDFEVYETKSKVMNSPGTTPSKIFEILLIPRKPGRFIIPEQELGYFSPADGAYHVKKAPSVDVVVEGQGGEGLPGAPSSASKNTLEIDEIEGLLLPEQWVGGSSNSSAVTVWGVRVLVLLSGFLLLFIGVRGLWRRQHLLGSLRKRPAVQATSGLWDELSRQASQSSEMQRIEIASFYQRVADGLYSELETRLELPARAWSREEMRRRIEVRLQEKKLSWEASVWPKVESILEYGEAVQFSGAVQDHEARSRMAATLNEIQQILSALHTGSGEAV